MTNELKLDNENTRKEYKKFEILGIADDELIILDEISNVTCCGEKSGQIHIITMRPLSEETIEYNKTSEALRDLWVEAVNADQTDNSLDGWADEVCYDADCNNQYFPFDDTSFRDETNDALEELSKREKDKIQSFFEEYCDNLGDTFKDFEVSSCTHYDTMKREGLKFQYTTKFGKKVVPYLDKFVEGEINFDELKQILEGE